MCRRENYEPSFTEDFKEAVSDPYFVDKTFFIKELIDNDFFDPPILITRPRGFGKTLTLSMVKTFFEKTEEDTSVYFKDLAIWSCGEKYTSEQGKYPVVYVDLTDLSFETYEEMRERFAEKMSAEFLRHTELAKNGTMDEFWGKRYREVVEKKSEFPEESVELLTRLLYGCDKVRPLILVDGFEVPLLAGLKHGYYEKAFIFFECMYSSSMKGNNFIEAGLIMGEFYTVLADDISGFNNVLPDTLVSRDYADGFGFTEEEVRGILKRHCAEDKYDEVRNWYGGYFMETRDEKFVELFNPDSVIRYLKNGCRAEPYRDEFYTSEALDRLLSFGNDYDRETLARFLNGESESCCLDESCHFGRLGDRRYTDYFQFLFMSGYLTRVKKIYRGYHNECYDVKIPNREIREIIAKQTKAHGYEATDLQK
ncbi:MAG: AAA family ATPase [Clostridia bacterium]|nr:AAA family ATPase [Clostridia bacterium]